MHAAADVPSPAAVSALTDVASRPAPASRPREAIEALLDAVVRGTDASVGVVWVREARDSEGALVAVVGLDDRGAAEALGRAADGACPSGETVRATSAGDGALGAALSGVGARHGLCVALAVGEARGGVVALAGEGPPAEEPLRGVAARVAADRIGAVLEVGRLRENLERAMAQILATDERMLGRIGLDIHDGPTQQLSVALLETQLLESELEEAERAGPVPVDVVRPALDRIYETVGGALHEMRELIGHLRPAQFEDRNLRDILQEAVTGFATRTDCRVDVAWEGEFAVNGVSITQRITLYRILQETLANAHRHGAARNVRVRVVDDPAGTTLEVADDGSGFDPAAVGGDRPGTPLARFGLHGMRDRARILGGSFDVDSAPGRGTRVRVFLPRWHGSGPEVRVDAA